MQNRRNRYHTTEEPTDSKVDQTQLIDLDQSNDLPVQSGILIVLAFVAAMPWLVRMYDKQHESASGKTERVVASIESAEPSEASHALTRISHTDQCIPSQEPDLLNEALTLAAETPVQLQKVPSAEPIENTYQLTVEDHQDKVDSNNRFDEPCPPPSYSIPTLTVRPPDDRNKCLTMLSEERPAVRKNSYPTTEAPAYQDWTSPATLPVLKVATPRLDRLASTGRSQQWIDPTSDAKIAAPNQPYGDTSDSFISPNPPTEPPIAHPQSATSQEVETSVADNSNTAPPVDDDQIADPPLPDLPPVEETVVRSQPTIQPLGPGTSEELNVQRPEDSISIEESTRNRAMRLENLARSADQRTQHAFELAGRGAMFAARQEFIESLRIISQGLDAEYKTGRHSRALAEGLRAVDEVDDFMPDGAILDAELNVRRIIEGHRTEALKTADLDRMIPLTAIRGYMTYAQQRLAEAMGTEAAGSMALRGLAKLYDTLSVEQPELIKAAAAKAMAIYQAALIVRKENYLAANDLGVLLARSGRDADARDVLKYALTIHRDATVMKNLAAINRRLGEADHAAALAREAAARAEQDRQARHAVGDMRDLPVRWVDQSELNGMTSSAGAAGTAYQARTARPIANQYSDDGNFQQQQNTQLNAHQNPQPGRQQTIRPAAQQPGTHWSGLPGGYGYNDGGRQNVNVRPSSSWNQATPSNYPSTSEPAPWYRNTKSWNDESVIK